MFLPVLQAVGCRLCSGVLPGPDARHPMSVSSPGCPPWAPADMKPRADTPVPQTPVVPEQLPDNPFVKLVVLLLCAVLQRRGSENVIKCKRLVHHVLDCGDMQCTVTGCTTTRSVLRRLLHCDCEVSMA
jgi:hypothetical protein